MRLKFYKKLTLAHFKTRTVKLNKIIYTKLFIVSDESSPSVSLNWFNVHNLDIDNNKIYFRNINTRKLLFRTRNFPERTCPLIEIKNLTFLIDTMTDLIADILIDKNTMSSTRPLNPHSIPVKIAQFSVEDRLLKTRTVD